MKPATLVARAAKFFDKRHPGWFKPNRVSLKRLNLAENGPVCGCVTAQLGLTWGQRRALPKLVRAATGWSLLHDGSGRDNSYHDPEFFDPERLGQYDIAWRNEIRKRRAAA